MLPTPNRLRISALQSRISHPHDVADRGDELAPALALGVECLATVFGDRVVASASLPGAFDPSTDDPAALFHPVEQGIERGDVEGEHATRSRLDEFRDLVSMSRLGLEEREDEEFGAALFQLGGKHGTNICVTATYVVKAHARRQAPGAWYLSYFSSLNHASNARGKNALLNNVHSPRLGGSVNALPASVALVPAACAFLAACSTSPSIAT